MAKLLRLGLQFFADGASAGAASGGEGSAAASGENATAAAEQRLRELGVPESKARERASKVASSMPQMANSSNSVATAATSEKAPTEDVAQKKPTLDELLKQDADYNSAFNQRMQTAIRERVKAEKAASQGAKDALAAMAPAIEVMARKYGLDVKNMDYTALAKAIEDDDAYYEELAIKMGVSNDIAKRVDRSERELERRKEAESISLEQNAVRQHLIRLEQQGEAMKALFPGFNLRQELKNPTFARFVDPKIGMSVEDAYYAVHRKEIQAASMQVAAQKTAEQISNAIQSGSLRPDESGTSGQSSSVSTFNYRNASKAEREALKQQIRAAAARGEKLYPTR